MNDLIAQAGRILADRGPDLRIGTNDILIIDGAVVVWPDGAESHDPAIRVLTIVQALDQYDMLAGRPSDVIADGSGWDLRVADEQPGGSCDPWGDAMNGWDD